MLAIDEILLLLKDGEWYDLKEITQKLALSKTKAEMAVNFLREYDFVTLSEETKVRIQSTMLKFIETTQRLDKQECLNH